MMKRNIRHNARNPHHVFQELGLAIGLATSAAVCAQSAVTGLRGEKIDLYDAPKGEKKTEVRKAEFKGPWQIKETQEGFFKVHTDKGQEFWVRRFAVETDQKIAAPVECNVSPAGSGTKSATTRGLGGECKPK